MSDLLAAVTAFAAALALLGIAVALWLLIDGLRARRTTWRCRTIAANAEERQPVIPTPTASQPGEPQPARSQSHLENP